VSSIAVFLILGGGTAYGDEDRLESAQGQLGDDGECNAAAESRLLPVVST
jgi:hypothetical protein